MLKPNHIFHTPEDFDELSHWIEQHPKEERHIIWIAVMMAWNLACKFANEEKENDDN